MANKKIILLPLLLFYIVIVWLFYPCSFQGDEERYIMYANNLSQGHYSPLNEIYLWNGPGYPLILTPFVLLKLPWMTARLLNPLLLFMAVLYFYKALCVYMKNRHALYASYLFALYPPFFIYLPLLYTEILCIFLVCGFIYHFFMMNHDGHNSILNILLASVYLGYLGLTKIFFGYVIVAGILIFLSLYILKRKSTVRNTLTVYVLALLICVPYLIYSYSLTKRIYYWGNSGGASLYWMSSPHEEEFGDWRNFKEVFKNPQLERHREFFTKLENLSSIERDDTLKRQAINNITRNPGKYFMNWGANIGRMLFNYPYSYTPQKMDTYFYLIPNIFLIVLAVLCIYPYIKKRKMIPEQLHFIGIFFLLSFIGSSLVSAYPRQFLILVPFVIFGMSFILTKVVNIKLQN